MADVGGFSFPGPELHFKPRLLPRGQLGGRKAPRRMVIRGDRTPNQRAEEQKRAQEYYDATVEKLQVALNSIMGEGESSEVPAKMNGLKFSQEELYRGVESLCRDSQSERAYKILKESMDRHAARFSEALEPMARRIIEMSTVVDADAALGLQKSYLKRVSDVWKEWSVKVVFVRNIFYYLDRSYLLQSENHKEIWGIAVELFDQYAFTDVIYEGIAYSVVSILRSFERTLGSEGLGGSQVNANTSGSAAADMPATEDSVLRYPLVSDLFSMLTEFPRVRTKLRNALFLDYDTFTADLAASCNSSGIVKYLQTYTQQKDFDIKLYASIGFASSEVKDIERRLDAAFLPSVPLDDTTPSAGGLAVLDGVGVLVNEQHLDLFRHLFLLSVARGMNDVLRNAFRQHIVNEGRKIAAVKESKTTRAVPQFLELYRKGETIANQTTAERGREFHVAMTEDALYTVLNENDGGHASSEKLAKYMDELLRPNKLGLSPTELEEQLSRCILLFQCVDGKHEFEAFYKALFAKRLLQNKTVGIETEKVVVSMLKGECGPGFTEKLETMISDVEISKQHMADFAASEQRVGASPQFSVNVLRGDHWPTYSSISLNLPPSLTQCQESFETFYKSKEKGRKLAWHAMLGSCLMKARFPHGTKELSLNMLQGVVLELFNDRESRTFEDVLATTGMTEAHATRTLLSLCGPKYKILVKEPETLEVNPSDVFRFNTEFKDKAYRIKVSTVQMREAAGRRDSDIRREAAVDRDDEIRAAIMRVMKARKQLKHVELVQQVIEVSKRRGTVDVRTIKRMLEDLIGREYIAREGSDQYKYIAE